MWPLARVYLLFPSFVLVEPVKSTSLDSESAKEVSEKVEEMDEERRECFIDESGC